MRIDEPNMYGAIATIRNGEATLRWTRMQVFLFFNSFAIPILSRQELDIGTKFSISAVGFAMTLIWFLVTVRAQQLMKFWDNSLRRLELIDFNQTDPQKSQPRLLIFSSRQYQILSNEWVSFHFVLQGIPAVATLVWAFFLGNYFYLLYL